MTIWPTSQKGNSMNTVSTSRFFVPALLGAALLAGPAMASELSAGQAAVTQLSPDTSAVTYFVDRPDGFHVIVSVRTGHDAAADALHQPPVIQFSSRILPGQTIDVSLPAGTGPAARVLEITRRAERVAVEAKDTVALVN
jgi:hypothetical protein